MPAGGPDGGPHPVLRRITRLLALAESPNLHEAEAAMNEARRLMLLHNVDAAATASADGYGYRHVGPVKARTETSERILAGILGRHFFVSVIWTPSYLRRGGSARLRAGALRNPGQPGGRRVRARLPDRHRRSGSGASTSARSASAPTRTAAASARA